MATKIGGEVTKTGGVKLRSEVGGTVGGAVTGAGGVRITSPVKAPTHIPSASDPGTAVSPLAPDEFALMEAPGPAGTITPRSRSFTNIRSTFDQPGWTFISPQGQKFIRDEKGVAIFQGYLRGADPADKGFSPGWTTDPRLGMVRQGEWTIDKMRAMYPEMFDQKFREAYGNAAVGSVSGAPEPPTGAQPQSQITRAPTAADRDRFEQIVFKQMGGNPFMMDPYQEVLRSDTQLPALFNHVFQGKIQYGDLGKLSKDQREYWEESKKEFHRKVWDQATNRRKQTTDQYTWMMAKYDIHAKEAQAIQAKSDKQAAAELAKGGKAPSHVTMVGETGQPTVHMWDPTMINPHNGEKGWWRDSGQRTAAWSIEDMMPPNVKTAQQFVLRFAPKIDPNMAMMAMLAGKDNPVLLKMIDQMQNPTVPAEHKANYSAAKKLVDGWYAGQLGGAGAGAAPQIPVAAASPTAPQITQRTPDLALSIIAGAIASKHPRLQELLTTFKEMFPSPEDQRRLEELLKAFGGGAGVSKATKGTAPKAEPDVLTPTPGSPIQ